MGAFQNELTEKCVLNDFRDRTVEEGGLAVRGLLVAPGKETNYFIIILLLFLLYFTIELCVGIRQTLSVRRVKVYLGEFTQNVCDYVK